MRVLINAAGYQLAWFAAVIAAARGWPWLAMLAPLAFAAAAWWTSHRRTCDARLLACALVLGVAIDGTLVASGLLRYAAATPALLAPLWILAIWVAFAMTLNHSLAFLQSRLWLAAALGGVGGPLAYVAAARGFDAVAFAPPAWRATAFLALAWAIAMPLLAALARHWNGVRPKVSIMEARQ